MSYKAIFKSDRIEREILNFSMHYFKADQRIISKWIDTSKHQTLNDLIEIVSEDHNLFKNNGYPYGGLFEITLESFGDDIPIYEWFSEDSTGGIKVQEGIIQFYNSQEEDIPFRIIQFKEAWISNIEEYFSSVGSSPMQIKLTISPGVVLHNKEIKVRRPWTVSDITPALFTPTIPNYDNSNEPKEKKKNPEITEVYWMDAQGKQKIDTVPEDGIVTLYAKVKNIDEGETFIFTMEKNKKHKKRTVETIVGKNGIVKKTINYFDYYKEV